MLERFPIDELLEGLRAAGFEVSVADQLRAFRLFEIVGADAPRDELRISIRPLFTSSEEEQQRFDDVFRSLGSYDSVQEISNSSNAAALHTHDRASTTKRPGLSRRMWIVVSSTCLLAAVLVFVAWNRDWFVRKSNSGSAGKATATDTSTTTVVPVPTKPSTETVRSKPISQPFAGARVGGDAKRPEDPPVRWVLLGAFIAFLVAFGAIADTARWLWRRFDSRGIAGRSPPFDFQRPPESDAAIFESQPIQQAATALRGRLAGERLEVDLRRTIRATVDGGGFPNFYYFGPAQSPEYLALIDCRSPDDHLATYFQLLVEQLTVCGAAIDIYTFVGDPRICTARDGTIVEAVQLRAERPTAKLLLFTDAEGLLDARTGVVHSWVDHGLGWDQRALLLPSIPQPTRFKQLSTHFAVERADAAGLLRVAQAFASTTITQATPVSDAPVGEAPSLAQLRRVLPVGVFRCLMACAVQRSLEWNATLAVGRVAHPEATEKELLELVRIGWFRHGSIPEAVREELLAILAGDAVLARAARNAVAQELRLRSVEAPRGSFAAEMLLVEAVAHDLAASEEVDRTLTDELRLVDPELIRRDDDLPRLLAPDRATPPSRWWRLRFRGGFSALGPSAMAYTFLMAVFAVLVALGGGIGELTQKQKRAENVATDTSATDAPSSTTSTTDTRFASSSIPPDVAATTPTPITTTTASNPPAGCSATARIADSNELEITFSKCGKLVPGVGESVRLMSGSGMQPMVTAKVNGTTIWLRDDIGGTPVPDKTDAPDTILGSIRPVGYQAFLVTGMLRGKTTTLSVRGVAIPLFLLARSGSPVSQQSAPSVAYTTLPCFLRMSPTGLGDLLFTGPCVTDGSVTQGVELLIAAGSSSQSPRPTIKVTGRIPLGSTNLLVTPPLNWQFYVELRNTRGGTVTPQGSRPYPFVVLVQPRGTVALPSSLSPVVGLVPANGTIVSVGSSQGLLLQWTPAKGATSYKLSLCTPKSDVVVIAYTHLWTNPQIGKCTWSVTPQFGGSDGTATPSTISIERRALFEMSGQRIGHTGVYLKGSAEPEVKQLSINGHSISIEDGKFALSTPEPTNWLVALAVLSNGATVYETKRVP